MLKRNKQRTKENEPYIKTLLITAVIKHWHIPFLVPDYAATTRDTTLSRVYNDSPLLISSLWNVGGLYDVVRYIMSVMLIF